MSPRWCIGAFRHFRFHTVNSSFSCIKIFGVKLTNSVYINSFRKATGSEI